MARHLREDVELVDREGNVRWHLGPPGGLLGRNPRAGTSVFTNVHPHDLPRVLDLGTAVLAAEPGWRSQTAVRLQCLDGSWRSYAIEIVNHLGDPALDGILVITREAPPEPPDALDAFESSEKPISESIAEAVPVALVVLDRQGRVEFANQAARSLCDFPPGPALGRHLPDVAVEPDRPAVTRALADLLRHHGSRTVVFATRGWQGRGEPRLIEARLLARGLANQRSTILAILEDVTDRRREEDDLRRRASSDPLTGVLNRSAVLEEMEARLVRGPITVIYCDLDGFKAINDTLGHAGGDELLIRVARVLTTMARATDVIGRLGGDEFVIVCDGLSQGHTANVVERLGDAFQLELGVRISVGVAADPGGGDAAALLARADEAMYENKRRLRRQAPGATEMA